MVVIRLADARLLDLGIGPVRHDASSKYKRIISMHNPRAQAEASRHPSLSVRKTMWARPTCILKVSPVLRQTPPPNGWPMPCKKYISRVKLVSGEGVGTELSAGESNDQRQMQCRKHGVSCKSGAGESKRAPEARLAVEVGCAMVERMDRC